MKRLAKAIQDTAIAARGNPPQDDEDAIAEPPKPSVRLLQQPEKWTLNWPQSTPNASFQQSGKETGGGEPPPAKCVWDLTARVALRRQSWFRRFECGQGSRVTWPT